MKKIYTLLIFILGFSSFIAQFTDDFESGLGAWTTSAGAGADNGDDWIISSSQANTGANSVFFDDYPSDHDRWLITPTQDLSGMTSPEFTYFEYVNWPTWAGQHNVLYSTDYTNDVTTATWTTLNSTIGSTAWTEFTYTLPVNSSVTVAFQYVGNYSAEWFIDDVSIIEAPSCLVPTSLTTSNTTSTSSDLSWIAGGSETAWNIEWGATGYTQGSGTTVPGVSNNTYSLTSLSAATTYDYYVQADCGSGDISTWAGPYTLSTYGSCGLYTIELTDSYGDGWNGGSLSVIVNSDTVISGFTLSSGAGPETRSFPVNNSDVVSVLYFAGSYAEENTYTIYDQNGSTITIQGASSNIPSSNVMLHACPTDDLTPISSASNVISDCDVSDSVQITMDIFNNGTASQTGFDVQYTINSGTPVTENISNTIQSGDTLSYTFLASADFSADGSYDVVVITALSNDVDTNNNSTSFTINNYITPASPTSIVDTICIGDSISLTATSSAPVINWYDADQSGNLLSSGSLLVSPTTTTSYWAFNANSSGHLGPEDTLIGTGGVYNGTGGLVFDALTPMVIDSVTVYPEDTTGSIEIFVVDSSGVILGSVTTTYNTQSSFEAVKIALGFYVPTGVNNMLLTTGAFYRNNAGAAYPYNLSNIASITAPANYLGGYYYYFYDWVVSSSLCEAAPSETIIVVDPCNNTNIELSKLDMFNVYPNPNNGEFFVINSQNNTTAKIIITDIQGKEVYNRSQTLNKGVNTQIQLTNIDKGMYIMSLYTNEGIQTVNLLIQ